MDGTNGASGTGSLLDEFEQLGITGDKVVEFFRVERVPVEISAGDRALKVQELLTRMSHALLQCEAALVQSSEALREAQQLLAEVLPMTNQGALTVDVPAGKSVGRSTVVPLNPTPADLLAAAESQPKE